MHSLQFCIQKLPEPGRLPPTGVLVGTRWPSASLSSLPNREPFPFCLLLPLFSADDGISPERAAQVMGTPDRCQHAAHVISELILTAQVGHGLPQGTMSPRGGQDRSLALGPIFGFCRSLSLG